MKTEPKTRLVFYIDNEERKALEKISEKSGAPVAELIRRAIADWLKKKEK
jgi:hypothetical protein